MTTVTQVRANANASCTIMGSPSRPYALRHRDEEATAGDHDLGKLTRMYALKRSTQDGKTSAIQAKSLIVSNMTRR